MVLSQFESHADWPNVLGLEWQFLTNYAPLIPGRAKCAYCR
jgi:hypothetical protein